MYRERSSIHLASLTATLVGALFLSAPAFAKCKEGATTNFSDSTGKKVQYTCVSNQWVYEGTWTTKDGVEHYGKIVRTSTKKGGINKKFTRQESEKPTEKKTEIKKEPVYTGKPGDLRLSDMKSLFSGFSVEVDGANIQVFGKFPKECASRLEVLFPEPVPNGDRVGFQFHDKGGFVECVKAHPGDTSGGLRADIPNSKVELSRIQSSKSAIRVGFLFVDDKSEKNPLGFEEYTGAGFPYKTLASKKDDKQKDLDDKKLAKVEKLKDVIAKCQGSLSGLKVAKSSLDEILAIKIGGKSVLDKKDYDIANNGLGDIELSLLKKAANKVKAEDMDGMLEDLSQFAARYPDRHDALAEVYTHLIERFSDDGSTQEEVATAQMILNDADSVLENVSEKGQMKLDAQRTGLVGANVFAAAQGGLQNNPYLPLQIQMGQLQASNDVMKYCSNNLMAGGMMMGMGGMSMMGGMNPFGAQNASTPGASGNGSSLCSAAMTSMQQIQLAYPRAMYTDYMQYQMMQQLQMQMYMAQQNPMMYAPLFGRLGGQSMAMPYGMNTMNPYGQNNMAMPPNMMQQNQLFSPQGTLLNTPPIQF